MIADDNSFFIGCSGKCLCLCLNILGGCENEMVKTITIRDAVYKKLLSAKRKDESFSELFERLTEGRNSVEVLKWLRGTVEFRDKEKLLAEINAKRAERRICS